MDFSSDMLLGPTGGFGAICFAAGFCFAWGLFTKFILSVATTRIEELKQQIEQERQICDDKLIAHEKRIQSLEQSRFDLAMSTSPPPVK